jgi:hypothetical protein
MEQYFFWSGVCVNAVGAFALCGLLAWHGIEWWVCFSGVKKPLMQWYWEKLKRENPRHPA